MNKYYKRLDIIRIFSCIAILFYHLGILKGGYLAVCTFFVLSGYLAVTTSFKKDKFLTMELSIGFLVFILYSFTEGVNYLIAFFTAPLIYYYHLSDKKRCEKTN